MQLTKHSAQLDQHSQARKRARLTQISMADYGLADRLGLVFGSPVVKQEVQGFEGAVVLERHMSPVQVFGCGADIVQERGEIIRF